MVSSKGERLRGKLNLVEMLGALKRQRLGHVDGSPVTESIYTHVISEDGKRVAAQLGNAVWEILDPNGPRKENGSGVEPPKPFSIN